MLFIIYLILHFQFIRLKVLRKECKDHTGKHLILKWDKIKAQWLRVHLQCRILSSNP